MTMQTAMWLAGLMGAIAVVNAALMVWLWRFPMVADPTGRDPNGVSTAPRFPTNVHRVLGYVFALAYLVLLFEMVPRAWQFRVATPVSVVHGLLGVAVGVILAFKIAVIRRYQRFGNRLPWIGGALAVTTIVVAALGVVPAWMVLRPRAPLSAELARGRDVVSSKCNQCHGASTIASEREDARKWQRITREMQRFSRTIPGKEPITDDERALAAAYLAHVLGEDGDDADDDAAEEEKEEKEEKDGERRRGRGRNRGGR